MLSIEQFCRKYREHPDKALNLLSKIDDDEAGAILIDAGSEIDDM